MNKPPGAVYNKPGARALEESGNSRGPSRTEGDISACLREKTAEIEPEEQDLTLTKQQEEESRQN